MRERAKFDAFLLRSASPFVFVLVLSCYDEALTALFAAIVRLFHFPRGPLTFGTHGDPTAHVIEGLLFAPLIESCILIGAIELLRWSRVPGVVQIFLVGGLMAWPHSYAWHWAPYAFVVMPGFVIEAAAYLYWRPISRKTGFAVVASMHALANLLPALYTVAYATRKV